MSLKSKPLGRMLCILTLIFITRPSAGATEFAPRAGTTVVESGWDRIVLDVEMDYEGIRKESKAQECYVAFPPRSFTYAVGDPVVFRGESADLPATEDYRPESNELPAVLLVKTATISSGIVRDRVVAQIRVSRDAVPKQKGGANGKVFMRRVRITVDFSGEPFPGVVMMPAGEPIRALGFDRVFTGMLCNYEASLGYRIRPAPSEDRPDSLLGSIRQSLERGESVFRIKVDEAGVYRVSPADLASALGTETSVDVDTLSLWTGDGEAPIYQAGTGRDKGSIYFYDDGAGTPYSNYRVYWLIRRPQGNNLPAQDIIPEATSEIETREFVRFTRKITSETLSAESGRRNGLVWFAGSIEEKKGATFPCDLPNYATGPVVFRIGIVAYTKEEFPCRLNVNGKLDLDFSVAAVGDEPCVRELTIQAPGKTLQDLGNNITITMKAVSGPAKRSNVLYVSSIEVDYWGRPIPTEGRLSFGVPSDATGNYRISPIGLDTANLRVFQVFPKFGPLRSSVSEGNSAVDFAAYSNTIVEIVDPEILRRAEKIEAIHSFDLMLSLNEADYVIVHHKRHREGLLPLVRHRESLGYKVSMVDVEDVFNAFGAGIPTPEAIRSFLRYTLTTWAVPPSIVLLVGDANCDFRNRTGTGVLNDVPIMLSPDDPAGVPSEIEYVDLMDSVGKDGRNGLPSMMLGRLPVDNDNALSPMAERSILYEKNSVMGPWRKRGLLTADHVYANVAVNKVWNDTPDWFQPVLFNYVDYDLKDYVRMQMLLPETKSKTKTSPEATRALLRELDRGCLIWDYFGHGGAHVLSNNDLFIGGNRYDNDIDRMRNIDKMPLFTSFSCLTGLFYSNNPMHKSIAEGLLAAEKGGTFACYLPMSSEHSSTLEHLSGCLKDGLFSLSEPRIGDVWEYAQISLLLSEPSRLPCERFAFFGDPATRLLLPRTNAQIEVVEQKSVNDSERIVSVRYTSDVVTSGTADFSVLSIDKNRTLLETGSLELHWGRQEFVLDPINIAARDEAILQVYAWNDEKKLDAVAATTIPALLPNLTLDTKRLRVANHDGNREIRFPVSNRTVRTERNVGISYLLDEDDLSSDVIAEIGPKEDLWTGISLPVKPGIHFLKIRLEAADVKGVSESVTVPYCCTTDEDAPKLVLHPKAFFLTSKVSDAALGYIPSMLNPVPGSTVRAVCFVFNVGNKPSPPSVLRISDKERGKIGDTSVPVVPPGEYATLGVDWIVPSDPPWDLAAEVLNRAGTVSSASPIYITPKPTGIPDLIVEPGRFFTEGKNYDEGDSIEFRIGFKNIGTAQAPGFSIGIAVVDGGSSNKFISNQIEAAGGMRWPQIESGLLPGATGEVSILWHPTGNLGTRTYRAVVDMRREVVESNKENNAAELEITTRPNLRTLFDQRKSAWSAPDGLEKGLELNRGIIGLLDREFDDAKGDKTWLDQDWFCSRAYCELIAGNLDEALKCASDGQSLFQEYGEYAYFIGNCLWRKGEPFRAMDVFRQSADAPVGGGIWTLWAGREDGLFVCGKKLIASEDETERLRGAGYLEMSSRILPLSSPTWMELGNYYNRIGDDGRAAQAYLRWVYTQRGRGVVWYDVKWMFPVMNLAVFERRDYKLARDLIDWAGRDGVRWAPFMILKAYLDMIENDSETALKVLNGDMGYCPPEYRVWTPLLKMRISTDRKRDFDPLSLYEETLKLTSARPAPDETGAATGKMSLVASKGTPNAGFKVRTNNGVDATLLKPFVYRQYPPDAGGASELLLTLPDGVLMEWDRAIETDLIALSFSYSKGNGNVLLSVGDEENKTIPFKVMSNRDGTMLLQLPPTSTRSLKISFEDRKNARGNLKLTDVSVFHTTKSIQQRDRGAEKTISDAELADFPYLYIGKGGNTPKN